MTADAVGTAQGDRAGCEGHVAEVAKATAGEGLGSPAEALDNPSRTVLAPGETGSAPGRPSLQIYCDPRSLAMDSKQKAVLHGTASTYPLSQNAGRVNRH